MTTPGAKRGINKVTWYIGLLHTYPGIESATFSLFSLRIRLPSARNLWIRQTSPAFCIRCFAFRLLWLDFWISWLDEYCTSISPRCLYHTFFKYSETAIIHSLTNTKAKNENNLPITYLLKKKKENRTTFTNALYLSIVPNTASWLAKNRDAILALISSQVIVSALWLAQTSLQGVYTLHYTFTLLQHEREFFYLQQYLAQYYNAATSHASLAQPLVIMLHLSFLSVLLKTSLK